MKQEKKQVEPPAESRVVYQHNAISRSIYSMSVNARRLIAMAMSKLPFEDGGYARYDAEFTVGEFMNGMGIKRGSRSDAAVLEAVRECMKSTIEMSMPDGNWQCWTWFSYSTLIREAPWWSTGQTDYTERVESEGVQTPVSAFDKIRMEFNSKLSDMLKSFKLEYHNTNWENFGKLQSFYAIRFYELAMSHAYLAGKGGNKPGEWYFPDKPYSIAELRRWLSVGKTKYKETHNFRRKCIDNPCAEINETDIGLDIRPQYEKRGKYLVGVWFKCRFSARHERNVTPVSSDRDEVDLEDKLKAAYPEKYEKYRAEYLSQPDFPGMKPYGRDMGADADACLKLRAEYPDFVKQWKATRKSAAGQSRPRRRG